VNGSGGTLIENAASINDEQVTLARPARHQ
jgi:hypothetical protein